MKVQKRNIMKPKENVEEAQGDWGGSPNEIRALTSQSWPGLPLKNRFRTAKTTISRRPESCLSISPWGPDDSMEKKNISGKGKQV